MELLLSRPGCGLRFLSSIERDGKHRGSNQASCHRARLDRDGQEKQYDHGKQKVSTICDELKLRPTVFYHGLGRFFENEAKAFESEEKQEPEQLRASLAFTAEEIKKPTLFPHPSPKG